MKGVHGLGVLALMALSATAGWVLLTPQAPERTQAPATVTAGAAPSSRLSVMAWPQPAADSTSSGGAAPRPAEPGAEQRVSQDVASATGSGDTAALARQLREGGESQREAALLRAHTEGVLLPEALLHRLMATDASEQVRMAAFEAYVELKSGSVEELRAALQAALAVRDTTLQTRAREQLDALERMQREAALEQQQP